MNNKHNSNKLAQQESNCQILMKYKNRVETMQIIKLEVFINKDEQTVAVKIPLILSSYRKLGQQLSNLPLYPLQLEGHHRGRQYQTFKNKMQLQNHINKT